MEVLTPQKKFPAETTLSMGSLPTAETRTDEDDDRLLVLEKTAECHTVSHFILNLVFGDGGNVLARWNIP